jgi:hypothetical protein
MPDELSPLSYERERSPSLRLRGSWRLGPAVATALVAAFALTAAAIPATAAASANAASAKPGTPAPRLDAVVVAPTGLASDADGLQALLGAHGVRGRLLYPPDVAVAHVSATTAMRLRADGFTVLRAGASPPTGSSRVRRAWRLVQALGDVGQVFPGPWPQVEADALAGDLRSSSASTGVDQLATGASGLGSTVMPGAATLLGQLPRADELAAFAAGSVAVSVIFTQSTGPASTEDWSAADPGNPGDRRAYVLSRIDLALAWWATHLPGAGLSFVIPPAGVPGAPQTAQVPDYEPIAHSAEADLVWRRAVMTFLGFTSDVPAPEVAYGDAVRRANGTDWAFTVYVVDSLHDTDGQFTDGLFAYTYDLFGPYTVLTYDNDGYGPRYFDTVMAHEMGHIFGALDEYYMPPSSGYPSGPNLHSGYLWVRNANAEDAFGDAPYSCIMRAGDVGITAYLGGDLCPSTRGQVGWRDADGDGVPNVVDTLPSLAMNEAVVSGDGTLTAAGTVRENPWPRGGKPPLQAFDHDISIFVPHDVRYRLDGGAWQPATPIDGAFDQPQESFVLSGGPLPDGHHVLEVGATTGGTTVLTRDVWAGPTAVQLSLSSNRRSVNYRSPVVFAVRSTASDGTVTYPVPSLPQVTFGRVGAAQSTLTTGPDGTVTVTVRPAYTGKYVSTYSGSGQFTGPASSGRVAIGVRVAIEAHRGPSPIRRGGAMRVWGLVRPAKPFAHVRLQETRDAGVTWRTVAWGRTDGRSRFSLVYRATHRGVVRLRVRYAGDSRNLAGGSLVAPFSVR